MSATLSLATNVNLNNDTLHNYSVTLTGNSLQAVAHSPSLAAGGDTLVAQGNLATLIGGAGRDSLVALGLNDILIAGSGANTLVGGKVAGSVSVLVGNGRSVLEYSGANTVFSLTSGTASTVSGANAWDNGFTDYKTDSIIAASNTATTAASSISTTLDKFDLSNTLNHGAGIANVRILTKTGSSDATLIGNTLADIITGGTGHNSLVAGGSASNYLDASSSRVGSTLVGNGGSSLVSGSGNDLYVLSKSGDKIYGGGTGTISLTSAFNDSAHGGAYYNLGDYLNNGDGVNRVGTLVYRGSSADTLIGGSHAASIKGGSGNNSLVAGSGTIGSYTLDASSQTGVGGSNTLRDNSGTAGSLIGGSGTNSFYVSNAGDSFSAASGAVNKVLTGLSQYNLASVNGTFAASTLAYTGTGTTTLTGNSLGGDTIYAATSSGSTLGDGGSGRDYLVGSSNGKNLYSVTSLGAGANTVIGGSGSDTIQVVRAGSISDAAFRYESGASIDALSLTSSSSAVLGSNAQSAGISTIAAGIGSDTINASGFTRAVTLDATSDTIGAADLLTGSATAGSEFLFSNVSALTVSTVNGGSGIDTIALTAAATLTDAALRNESGKSIDAIQLTSSSSATLASNAQAAGISTIIAGTGPDTVNAAGFTRSVTLDATADTTGAADLLTGSATAGSEFLFSNTSALTASTLIGGSGTDTIALTSPATLGDAAFSHDSSIERLQLTSSASATLGSYAQAAGISTVIAGTGADTVNASGFTRSVTLDATANTTAASDLLIGSSTAGTDVLFSNVAALTSSTVKGGTGIDTLALTSPATVADAVFRNDAGSSIDVLQLTSSASATLGSYAQAAGISTVIAGTGADTVNASLFTRSVTLDATADTTGAADLLVGSATAGSEFLFSSVSALTASTVIGGSGIDTLALSAPINGVLTNGGMFAHVSGVEDLLIQSSSAVTLGNSSSFRNIILGSGPDTIDASGSTGSVTLDAGASSSGGSLLKGSSTAGNLFIEGSGSALSSTTLVGGSGADTLQLAQGTSATDATFTNLQSVEVLRLSANSSATLGAAASLAGISTVIGSGGSDTIVQLALDSKALTLIGTTGNDSFSVATATQLLADSIYGGGGVNTLQAGAGALSDSLFAKVSQVQALQLTSASAVSLGSAAQSAGISSVFGGTGSDSFIQLAGDTAALTLIGGGGADSFNIANLAELNADSINGGTGINTLQVAAVSSISDTSFAKVSNIQALNLTSASSVTLGAAAQAAGISTVYGGTGGDTFTQLAEETGSLVLVAGSGGNNVFSLANPSNVSVIGGGANNSVAITGSGIFQDNEFSHFQGVNSLSMTGANNVIIGIGAQTSGIHAVYGGTGNSTFTQTTAFTDSLTIGGGSGNDSIYIHDQNLLNRDSISGGSGVNTLTVDSSAVFNDSFNRISGIQALSLSGPSNVSLGAGALAEGLTSLFGGAGNDTFRTSDSNVLINAGSGNNLVSAIGTRDTIISGTGSDTITSSGDNAVIASGNGNKSITATGNYDSVSVGSSATTLGDTINVTGTNATIVAGNGTNLVNSSGANSSISLNGIADTLAANGDNDTITTGNGNDSIVSAGNAVSIRSGYGNDTIQASGNNDSVILGLNGSGNDIINVTGTNATIAAGNGNDFVSLTTGGNSSISLGSGSDTVSAAGNFDTVIAGNGNDFITLTGSNGRITAGGGNDQIFSTGSNSSINLGNGSDTVYAAGNFDTVIAGNGNDFVTLNGTNGRITAGDGNDQIFSTGSNSFVSLGNGSDTVSATGNFDTVIAGNGFDILTVNGTNASIVAGSGDDSITSTGDYSTIIAASGNDTISAAGNNDIVVAGNGNNIISAVGKNLFINAGAGNNIVSGIGDSATLAANGAGTNVFYADGLDDSITSGSGPTTVTMGGTNSLGDANLNLTSAQINGGTSTIGQNILNLGFVARLKDTYSALLETASSFFRVQNFQKLNLLDGGSAVTLGYSADVITGINTVTGSTAGGDTIDASGYSRTVTLDGSSATSGDWLVASSTVGTEMIGGSGNDSFFSGNGTLLSLDTILGGSGSDTLTVTGADTFGDSAFANISSVENLVLTSSSNVTLGSAATLSGLQRVSLGAGPDTIDASAFSNSITLDASSDTVTSGKGDLLIGSANALLGSEFLISSQALGAATIIGGTGTDTVQLTTASTIADSSFANLTSIEALQLFSASKVSLGSSAQTAGITSVTGGTGNDTINQLAGDTNSLTLIGGGGNDSFNIANLSEVINDSISGGAGVNTLQIGSSQGNGQIAVPAGVTLDGGAFQLADGSYLITGTNAYNAEVGYDYTSNGIINGAFNNGSLISAPSGYTSTEATLLPNGKFQVTAHGTGNDLVGQFTPQGRLDTTFGDNGLMAAPNGGILQSALKLADGSFLVTVSDSFWNTQDYHYNANGQLDTFFGAGTGMFVAPSHVSLSGLGIELADGSILIAGEDTLTGLSVGVDFSSLGGSVNTAFASGGIISSPTLYGTPEVNLLKNGEFQIAAYGPTLNANDAIELVQQYNADGSIDTNFGNQGSLTGHNGDTLVNVVNFDDGTYLLTELDSQGVAHILHADSLGHLDTNIGNGTGEFSAPAGVSLDGGAIQLSDGSYLLAGTLNGSTTVGVNYTQAGVINTAYGTNGLISGPSGYASPSGNLLTGGQLQAWLYNLSGSEFFGQWTNNGQADTSFGNGGVLTAPNGDTLLNVTPLADGSFVVTALDSLGNMPEFHYTANGQLDTAFGAGTTINIADSTFTKVSNIQDLQLTSPSSVTLGYYADRAGFATVNGGNANDTITQLDSDTRALTLIGGGGSDSFNIANLSELTADSISGGIGINTLQVATAANIADIAFTQVSSIQALQLTSDSALTLSGTAQNAGIASVFGGSGNDTITQLAADSTALTLIAGNGNNLITVTANHDSIVAGNGNNAISATGNNNWIAAGNGQNLISAVGYGSTLSAAGSSLIYADGEDDSIVGGSGPTTITLGGDNSDGNANLNLTSATTISGGTGSNNTLELGFVARIVDSISSFASSFYRVFNIQKLTLLDGGSAVTLGYSADQVAGFNTVVGSTGGSDTIDASEYTRTVTLDASDATSGDRLVASTLTSTDILGGSGNDAIFVKNASLLSSDTIVGGNGNDTITLTTSDVIADTAFANISSVEALQLTSASSVSLGSAAQYAGISSVFGGVGSDTFSQLEGDTSSLTLSGGGGADFFSIATASQLANDSVNGGVGINTLQVATADAIGDAAFAGTSNIQVLTLTSASSVSLGSAARSAGISSIYGGTGNDTISQLAEDTSSLTLIGGGGSDSFNIANLDELRADSISGGAGVNTLQVASASTIDDSAFSAVASIQALQLTSASSVSLGSAAQRAGIASVYGGLSGDTFTQLANDTASLTLIGGGDNDSFNIANVSELTADSIYGGAGINTLQVATAGNIDDTAFARVSNIQDLQLTSSSRVTLRANAQSAGINAVYGGNGNDTVDATDITNSSGIFTISMRGGENSLVGSSSASNIIVGGNGNDTIVSNGSSDHIFTGDGNNLVEISNAANLANDIVTGGVGSDTLRVNNAANIADSAFAGVSGFSDLQLTSNSAVTLSSEAYTSGFTTITGGTGSDTFVQLVGDQSALYLDGSKGTSDLFAFDYASLIGSVTGGSGINTLADLNADTVIDIGAGVSNVQVLSLTSATSAILGLSAQSAGILTVVGGAGGDTISTAAFTRSVTLDASADTNTVPGSGDSLVGSSTAGSEFILSSSSALTATTIVGGAGIDTLRVKPADQISDASFTNLTSIEELQLTSTTSVSLGSFAQSAGFSTIIGGSGGDTITQLAGDTASLTIIGGGGSDSFNIASVEQFTADSINGGAGINTLEIAGAPPLTADNFTRISNIQDLVLSSGTSLTLDSGSGTAWLGSVGISTIDASSGNSTVNAMDSSVPPQMAPLTIIGGAGDQYYVSNTSTTVIDNQNYSSNADTLITDLQHYVMPQNVSDLILDGYYADVQTAVGNASSNTIAVDNYYGNYSIVGGGGNDFIVGSDGGNNTLVGNSNAAAGAYLQGSEVVDANSVTLVASYDLYQASATSQNVLDGGSGISTLMGGLGSDTYYVHNNADAVISANTQGYSGAQDIVISYAPSYTLAAGVQSLEAAAAAGQITLNANNDGDVLIANNSGNTIVGGTGADTMLGGTDSDLFQVGYASLAAADSIVGGGGNDTLFISNADNIGDTAFGGVFGVKTLQLTNNSSVTLGAEAQNAVITSIYAGNSSNLFWGSADNDTITQDQNNTSALTIVGSGGGDLFQIATAAQLSQDSIVGSRLVFWNPWYGWYGNSYTSTLQITNADNIADASFEHLSQIGALQLTSASSVSLGSAARSAGISSIYGGTGNDTISQLAEDTSSLTLIGGTGSDSFNIATTSQLANDSINGGAGINTLQVASADTISDSAFAKTNRIQALQLTSASSVTLDGNAMASGIASVFGGIGSDTFTQLAGDTASLTLIGGGAADVFNISDASELSADSINGGAGINTLQVVDAASVSDSAFTQTSNIQALKLGDEVFYSTFTFSNASHAVSLGSAAQSAGISTVYGGTGQNRITQLASDTSHLTLIGASNQDLFNIATAEELANDSIVGSENYSDGVVLSFPIPSDTLAITTEGTLGDTAFTHVSNIGNLQLTGSSSATLGAVAQAAGIKTIYGGAGPDTIDASGFTSSVTLNATADTLGADSLVGSSTAGTEFLVANAAALSTTTVVGGTGTDNISDVAQENIGDASFANVSSVESLAIAANSSVTLGANAQSAGISFVSAGIPTGFFSIGTNGNDTITQLTSDNSPLTLLGEGLGNYYNIGSAAQLAKDSINGGDTGLFSGGILHIGGNPPTPPATPTGPENTLQITQADNIVDADFARVSNMQVLQLTSASSVSLGSAAKAAGITWVVGGTGNDTFTQLAGATTPLVLHGGSGNDSFSVANLSELTVDRIIGGSGTNTLQVATASNITDTAFAQVSNIQALQLTSASSVSLGSAAQASGISSVYGGLGNDTFTQLDGDTASLTLIGGGGSDSFNITSSSQLGADSISGGAGINTLQVASAANLTDASFAQASNIQALQLTSASSVSLGSAAQSAGISSVYGGAGSDTFTQLSGDTASLTLLGGGAADVFNIATASQLTSDSINGGQGINTLQVTSDGAIEDSAFAQTSNIQALQLTSASSVSLGSAAQTAGISSVFGGAGSDTFIQTAGNTVALTLVGGGDGDLFNVATASQLANDSISGGAGINTLQVATAGAVTDAAFARVSNIQDLQISSSSTITLGTNAQAAGIDNVLGGAGSDTVDASAINLASGIFTISVTGGNNSIFGSSSTTNVIMGGSGNDTIVSNGTSDQIFTGNGNNLVVISDAANLPNDLLINGTGIDTLQLGTASNIADTLFAGVSGFSALKVTSSSVINLGTNASTEGFSSVYGGAGSDTFIQTADDTNALTLVGGGAGDSFNIATISELTNDSINGGAGINSLQIGTAGILGDTAFNQVSNIQLLQITSASAVSLGLAAKNAGIATVIGGSGSDTFTQTAGDTNSLTLIGGGAADVFNIATVAELTNDSINGGAGINTLQVITAGAIEDSAFAQTANIQALQLTSVSSVSLGSSAQTAGISSVYGGAGSDSFTQLASDTNSLLLSGGGSGDFFNIATAAELSNDTIIGGTGINTLQISTSGNITDPSFSNVSSIQAIQLTSDSAISLGSGAQNLGLSTVYGGTGSDTFTQLDGFTNNISLIGGGGNDSFNIANLGELSADSIYGGAGINTLQIATASTITDSSFAQVSRIQALQLISSSSVTLGAIAQTAGLSTIYGGTGTDTVDGSAFGNDFEAIGTGGNNYFTGGANNRVTLLGGSGNNTLISGYHNHNLITAGDGTNLISASLSGGFDTITAGNGNDTILISSGGLSRISVGNGNDSLTDGSSSYDIIVAGNGNDTIIGGAYGHSSILAGNGNNYLTGGDFTVGGYDTIASGTGNSTLIANYGGHSSLVAGNAVTGGDSLVGSATGYDTMVGGSGNDTFLINGSNDSVSSGLGNDSFVISSASGLNALTLHGGAGVNTLSFTTGSQSITDSSFTNISGIKEVAVTGGGNTVSLGSHAQSAGVATLLGSSSGGDTLSAAGISSNMVILGNESGSAAGSYLAGGSGNDTIQAFSKLSEVGIDTLSGGAGADLFVLGTSSGMAYMTGNTGTPSLKAYNEYALITDFNQSAGDRLQLKGTASNYYLGALPTGLPAGYSSGASNIALYYHPAAAGLLNHTQDELMSVIHNSDTTPGAHFNLITAGKYV